MKSVSDKFRGSGAMACAIALAAALVPLHAYAEEQSTAIKTLKGDITEARNVQRVFADGLQHCAALDGKSFYSTNQKRVMLLSELETSLKNLVKDQVFNPQKKHPWMMSDADERMKLAQLQADHERRNCDLVARLPEMTKQLSELEARQ